MGLVIGFLIRQEKLASDGLVLLKINDYQQIAKQKSSMSIVAFQTRTTPMTKFLTLVVI
jgi:hypothetical protein